MNKLDIQTQYWNKVANQKTFTHPLPWGKFKTILPAYGKILDVGCGYGRTCIELMDNGFQNVIGVDISSQMIKRGKTQNPNLDLREFNGRLLPFEDNSFDFCTLLAVLTCIPTNDGQQGIMDEIKRVLRPDGVLLVSDYPFQSDDRNQARYKEFQDEFGTFGVFRLADDGIVRHHDMEWIHNLLSDFHVIHQEDIQLKTMNGNDANIFQILGKLKKNGG